MNCSLHTRRWLFTVIILAALTAFVLLVISVPADADSTIYGTVTDADTEDPIEGASVYLRGEDNEYETSTDKGGEYSLDCASGKYELSISADGYQAHRDSVNLEEGENKEYNARLEKEAEENSKIFGYVTDKETEDPIEEARVRVYNKNGDYYAQTDGEGYYEVNCYAGHYTIEVEHSGYEKYTGEEDVAEDEEVQHDVALEPEGPANSRVYGQVTDAETGDGISEASVYLKNEENSYSATTDDTGNYEITCHSGNYDITINKDGYTEHSGEVSVEEEDEVEYNAELEKDGEDSRVHGQVTDKDTGGGIGADVYLDGEKNSYHTHTDRSGFYEIECSADEYRVTVRAEGYKDHYGEVSVGEGEEVQYDVEMEKDDPPDSQLHGTVIDADTEDPIEGATVRLENSDYKYSANTDEGGYYEIDCYSGDYEITISAKGYETHYGEVTVKPGDDNEYNAELRREAGETYLEGYVRERSGRDDGDPVEGALVRLYDGEREYEGETDKGGYYRIDCVEGEYTLEVSHEDYEEHEESIRIVEGSNRRDVDLEPKAVARIYGYVTDSETSDPIYNARIRFEDKDSGETTDVETDGEGWYSVELSPGDFDILVSKDDYDDLEDEISLEDDDEEQRDFELTPEIKTGEVWGTVKDDRNDNTIEDVILTFTDRDTSDEFTASTDEYGDYAIELVEGTYDISIDHEDYQTNTDEVTVTEDGNFERDYRLDLKESLLSGAVLNTETEEGVDSATVTATAREGRGGEPYSKTVDTDGNGDYELSLPAGDYEITIEHEDYLKYWDNISMMKEEDNEQDFEVTPRERVGTVAGRVTETDTETALEGASVVFTGPDSAEHTAITDEYGDYEITLPEADYDVSVEMEGYESAADTITIEDQGEYQRDYGMAIISEPSVEKLGPIEGDFPDGASYSVTAGVTGPGDLEVDVTTSPDPEDDKNLGLFLDIQFDGADEDLKWVHIIIYYNEVPDGLEASKLMIYYWDVIVDDWELAENNGVNIDEKYVWANVTHLTVFGPRDVSGAVVKNYGVSVTGSQENTVKAGEAASFVLNIENTGEEEDTFDISLSGSVGGWGSLELEEVTLGTGKDRNLVVTVTVPEETTAGTYDLMVIVSSQGNPAVEETLTLTTTVEAESEAESKDSEWYKETFNLVGIIAVIIVAVITAALLFSRKRNGDFFDEWDDEEDDYEVW